MFSGLSPRKRGRKPKEIQLVRSDKRATRSSVHNGGFRLEPMRDCPEPRKKPRSSKPVDDTPDDAPVVTPISALQAAGKELGIDAQDLSKEKLEVSPSVPSKPRSSNDE